MGKQQGTGLKPTSATTEEATETDLIKVNNPEGEAIMVRVRAATDEEIGQAVEHMAKAGGFAGVYAALETIFGTDAMTESAEFRVSRHKDERAVIRARLSAFRPEIGHADFMMTINPVIVDSMLTDLKRPPEEQKASKQVGPEVPATIH